MTIDNIVIIFWIISVIVVLWTSKINSGGMFIPSVTNLFCWFFILMIYIASLLFYIDNPEDNKRFIFYSSLTLFSFSLGVWLANMSFTCRFKSKLFNFIHKPLVDDLNSYLLYSWCLISILSIIVTLIYLIIAYKNAGAIPLIKSVKGVNILQWIELRHRFSKVPGAGYFSQFSKVLLPVTTGIFLLKATFSKKWKIISLFILFFCVFELIAPGSRAPILYFLIFLMMTYFYIYGNLLKNKTIKKLIVIGIFFMIFLTGLKFRSSFIRSENINLAGLVLKRIFIIQALGDQFIFEYIPSSIDYFLGKTILMDLKGLLPGVQEGFSSILPGLRGKKSFNNPIGIMGDLYINFGPIGLILGMITYGFICQLIYIKFLTGPKTITRVAIYSWIMFTLAYGAIAGIIGVIFQFGIVTVILSRFLSSIMYSFVKKIFR